MQTNLSVIEIDPEKLSGTPVFHGTRVPIETLFAHLKKGITLEEFLYDFPSVTKEQALEVLEIAENMLTSKNLKSLYENFA
jgi:uncharacterized protein (DUF433 family)